MALEKSKIVPAAFWVGFLALGFVTSLDARHRPQHGVRGAVARETVLAQTRKPAQTGTLLSSADQN